MGLAVGAEYAGGRNAAQGAVAMIGRLTHQTKRCAAGDLSQWVAMLVLASCSLFATGWAGAQVTAVNTAKPACPPPPDALTPERIQQGLRNAQDRGPLWRITQAGQSSWLYGTAHVSSADWVFPGRNVVRAMQQADMLALELNLLDAESLKPLIQPADPARIARVLDATRLARIARLTDVACLPPNALDTRRPVIQAATLLALDARHSGFYVDFGIDAMLAGLAQSLKKPIVALESAQDQLDLLSGRNETEERLFVDSALDQLESGKARGQMKTMLQVWAQADVTQLDNYADWCNCMDTAEDRAFMKRLLDDRNVLMAEKISQLHASGKRVFAGVGVLHMVGAQGLPALMRAQGFQVELVSPTVNTAAKP